MTQSQTIDSEGTTFPTAQLALGILVGGLALFIAMSAVTGSAATGGAPEANVLGPLPAEPVAASNGSVAGDTMSEQSFEVQKLAVGQGLEIESDNSHIISTGTMLGDTISERSHQRQLLAGYGPNAST